MKKLSLCLVALAIVATPATKPATLQPPKSLSALLTSIAMLGVLFSLKYAGFASTAVMAARYGYKDIRKCMTISQMTRNPHLDNLLLVGNRLDLACVDPTFMTAQQIRSIKRLIRIDPIKLLDEHRATAWKSYHQHYQDGGKPVSGIKGKLKVLYTRGMNWLTKKSKRERELEDITYNGPIALQQAQQKTPLCLLSECVEDHCVLNRDRSRNRTDFETEVIREIEQQAAQEKRNAVNYVNLGSGKLFQDLIIFTRLLEKNKNIPVNIHLIDRCYSKYLAGMQDRSGWRLRNTMRDEKYYQLSYNRFRQFLQWFACAYPGNKLQFFIHGSVEDYGRYVELSPDRRANIIVGSDLDRPTTHTPSLDEMLAEDFMPTRELHSGLEAYLGIAHNKLLKSHGIGMLLYKCSAGGVYVKTLPMCEVPGDGDSIWFAPRGNRNARKIRFMVQLFNRLF